MKKLLLVLTLALLAVSPVAAQDWWQWKPFPACTDGQVWVWSSGGMTCAANSSTDLVCTNCIGGTEIDESTLTLAAYVLVTKAGQQSVTATGAGNDVSLVAADDVLLTPTDALTAAVGGAAAITTTAGDITLTAGGTTEDISLVSVDDVILTPTGSLTVTAADAAVGVTTSFAVDVAGGTDEFGISENAVSVSTGILFRIVPTAAPPAACGAGTEGGLYLDADTHLLCVCDATGWVQVADGTTGCS